MEAALNGPSGGITSEIWEKHKAAIVTALCLVLIIIAYIAGKNNAPVLEIALFILAYLVGGYQKALEGMETLVKEKDLDVDLLMVVAAIGAAAIGYWMDGAILIFIFSLSGALEEYSMEKTGRDIRSLMGLIPEEATLLEDGRERKVGIGELRVGDMVIIRPGEKIAADGIITAGFSSIYEATITGEYLPADKEKGHEVFSGTINGQGAIEVRVSKPAGETTIAKIIHLVRQAQDEKPPAQQFVERFEGIYSKAVVAIAILFILLPPLLLDWSWQETIYRAMIFLVVASPCALVSSIMPAILAGISNAARHGVLFKGGVHLQNISDVKVVTFDKTGTLTIGQPKVIDIIPFQNLSETGLLQITASLESHSEHPIARAITQVAIERQINISKPTDLQALHGLGISAKIDSREYFVGKKDVLKNVQISEEQAIQVENLETDGKTVIYIATGERLLGLITIQDKIRGWASRIVGELKQMGIKTVMLTGDTETTARAVSEQAGIELYYAELLPEQKVEMVKQLRSTYGKVAMIGDGVNDAPALAAASVGIAVGSGGTDIAIETADVILVRDNIENIPFAINLGRRTQMVIKQNIVFAIAVALTLVTLNFIGGRINLPEGVIGHEGSTVLVILSGLRLLR
ncbi:heavy metal translocating P-type ATPase [Pedobacter chinensis]|uniref:Heavy metal translocating P-type ATPase n=1 Tax=Pedobacter chinensis TaxID=2282421 RepID=A0A369PUB8_9SPHI|nr:heavy metal translocating P-type ATPase [Pedobacter chinensis]RDC54557.1 heavy metal translocating P-type ATPase [Pedobacter chinensis]